MRRCCFLSMDDLGHYVADDELAVRPLRDLGWLVETVSWRDKTVDWNDFEIVVIRTPWDYQREPEAFLAVLETIDASSARLENPIGIVRWNLNKKYLLDLENKGLIIVPTLWINGGISAEKFDGWLDPLSANEVVIKPTVSATAEFTYRLRKFDPGLTPIFESREYMVQPFMPHIVAEGEFSLFYFDGDYSHTILKTPKSQDFRVQEEHGGMIRAVTPSARLLETAREVFNFISPTPLYARVDFVRDARDNFALMELELIEPALYFRMDGDSPARFARALDRRF